MADLDHNGVATFAERMRYAIEQSGDVAYEQSVFCSGIDYVDDGFGSSGKTDPREPIQTVTKVDELDSALREVPMEEYVLVAFTAPAWCDPCREMEEIYPKLPPHIRVIKVDLSNREQDYEAFKKSNYQISAVPQFRLFGRGLPREGMRFDARAIGNDLPTTINRLITERDPMIVFQEWLFLEDYIRFKSAFEAFVKKISQPGNSPIEKARALQYQRRLIDRMVKILDGTNDSLKLYVLRDVPPHPLYLTPREKRELGPRVLSVINPLVRKELIVEATNWLGHFDSHFDAEMFRRASTEPMLTHANPEIRKLAPKIWYWFVSATKYLFPKNENLVAYHQQRISPHIRKKIVDEKDANVQIELAYMILAENIQNHHPSLYRLEEAEPLLVATNERGNTLINWFLAVHLYKKWGTTMPESHEKNTIAWIITILWWKSDNAMARRGIENDCPLIFQTGN